MRSPSSGSMTRSWWRTRRPSTGFASASSRARPWTPSPRTQRTIYTTTRSSPPRTATTTTTSRTVPSWSSRECREEGGGMMPARGPTSTVGMSSTGRRTAVKSTSASTPG
uniref:Uncharacterized protein n=1 Tax=Anguilla anguilla TaxID=7936 RepID=A0A0E9WYI6_ANGAN